MNSPIPCLCSDPSITDNLTPISEPFFSFVCPSFSKVGVLEKENDILKQDKADLQKELKIAKDKVANLLLLNESSERIIAEMNRMSVKADEKMRKDQEIIDLYKQLVKQNEKEARDTEEELRLVTEERDDLLKQLRKRQANEKNLQKEKKELRDKLEQYRNTAIAYKKKLKEQTEVAETKTPELGFQDQLNGKWKYIYSQKSEGFELPAKFRPWWYGTLHLNLKGEKFSSHVEARSNDPKIQRSEVILGKNHSEENAAEGWTCRGTTILKADHLITWETSFCSQTPCFTDCRIDRSIKNGLLIIALRVGNTIGKYTFEKCK